MVQKTQSKLMQKYGAKLHTAVVKHADDDIVVRGGIVPPGITDGVCQLTECCFKVYEKDTKQKTADGKSAVGEYYFYAMGVLQEDFPNDLNQLTRGLQTRIGNGFGIPVFDTKKKDGTIVTQEEWIAEIENEMKKLGIPKESFTGGDVLEELAAALQEAQPFFKISTSKGKVTEAYPDPRTWENWGGVRGLEDYAPPSADSAVQDNTTKPAPKTGGVKPPADTLTAQAPADEPPFGDGLDDLVAECNSEDVDTAAGATEKMSVMASELGIDASTVPTWEEVAQLIRDAKSSGDTAGVAESNYAALGTAAENGDQEAADSLDAARQEAGMDDDTYGTMSWTDLATWLTENAAGGDKAATWAPAVGEVYQYKPIDPKTKKKVAKAIECEVLTVSGDNVTLKNLVDGKTVMNLATKKALLVPQSELEQ